MLLSARTTDLSVVPDVDLKRYQGRWFEIARLPNRFQKKCAGDVTATYTLRGNQKIRVLNTCRESNGRISKASGTARLRDGNGPAAKLKVTFFGSFSGDYWIIDLDHDYGWAVVGTPNRKYLWILSRTPDLPRATYDRLLARAKFLGFDTRNVQRTAQQS